MSEKPIIMCGESVRALLAGRKTQTRRIIRAKTLHSDYGQPHLDEAWADGGEGEPYLHVPYGEGTNRTVHRHYPAYAIGDVLWVREALVRREVYTTGPLRAYYEADFCDTWRPWSWKRGRLASMFMPKEFARLWLTVTNVRVQRLHEMRPDDIRAEGCPPESLTPGATTFWWMSLWMDLHGKDAWNRNPWVWVYEFPASQSTPGQGKGGG